MPECQQTKIGAVAVVAASGQCFFKRIQREGMAVTTTPKQPAAVRGKHGTSKHSIWAGSVHSRVAGHVQSGGLPTLKPWD